MNVFKIALIALFLSNTCSAITYRGDVTRAKFQSYGSEHDCVIRICAVVKETKYKTYGSGVVIGPHIVLTAAHVMTDVENSNVVIGSKIYPIRAAVCPDAYRSHKYGVADIAVCYTDDVIPQKFYVKLYDKKDEVGQICSIAGWGRSGSFRTGHQSYTKKVRLAGSNIIDGTDRDMLVVSPTRSPEDQTSLECIVSPGDSGGGMFVGGRLAGIHSVITTNVKSTKGKSMLTGGFHCYSGSTRVSIFREWIMKTADQLTNFYKLSKEINNIFGDDGMSRDIKNDNKLSNVIEVAIINQRGK